MWITAKKKNTFVIHRQPFPDCYMTFGHHQHLESCYQAYRIDKKLLFTRKCGRAQLKVTWKWPELQLVKATRVDGDRTKGRQGVNPYAECGEGAQAWPQLPRWKTAQQLSRMYRSSTPKPQQPVVTTSGSLSVLFHCGHLTSLSRQCNSS